MSSSPRAPAHPWSIVAGRPAAALERSAQILLVALGAILPFEVPLFRLGPLQLTSIEVVLYALVGAWGLGALARGDALRTALRALRHDPWVQVAAAWAAVTVVSALLAPSYRGASFKFALRSVSGVLAFFAARTASRSPVTWRQTLWALIAGAVISAVSAEIDAWVPHSDFLWRAFREANFSTFGLRRASGVFGYPTIGAMYWEACVPLVVAAPLLATPKDARTGRRAVAFAAGASVWLIGAILASATRSGLAGVLVAALLLLAFGAPAGPWLRRSAAGVLAVLATCWAFALGGTHLLSQRLRWWHDDEWLHARYEVEPGPLSVSTREVFNVRVRVHNTGTLPWRLASEQPTRLAYHWQPLSRPTTIEDFEGWRTELPRDVEPGGVVDVVAQVRGPSKEGPYRLRWDLVREGVSWFSDCGNSTADVAVAVSRSSVASVARSPLGSTPVHLAGPPPPPRPALWRAAIVLWRRRPLLGIGPDNFRRSYEPILSPSPDGKTYTDQRIHANNWYFETLADLGLIGLAALLAIGFVLGREVRRALVAGSMATIGAGLAAALFFVHGAFDYFLEFTPLYGLFWVLLGLTAASAAEPRAT